MESDAKEHSKKLCNPAHDDEQNQQAAALQRQDQQQESNTEQRQNTCQVHTNTYSCVIPQCIVCLQSIRSRYPVVRPHRMPKKRCKKRCTPNQRRARTPGIKPPTSFSEYKLHFIHPLYRKIVKTICICPYEWTIWIFWPKNVESTPRRKMPSARPRAPPAESGERSKVGRIEQTPHGVVDLISG